MKPNDLPQSSFHRASLEGKVAVVTGSTQGLGEATARLFFERGCKGIVLTGRNEERGKSLANELTKTKTSTNDNDNNNNNDNYSCLAIFVKADLGDMDDVQNIFKVTDSTFGKVDILVNAAATTNRGSLWDTTPEDYDEIMNVNTKAPFFLMQYAAYIMEREKIAGSIINISSTASYGSMPMLAAYGMSKAALNVATKNAAYSLMWSKIRVNALAIGWMDTPGEDTIQRKLHCSNDGDDWKSAGEANQPFGRLLQPDEVARCIAFCASEESGMMTGCVIDFDQSVWGAGNAPVPPRKDQWARAHGMTFSFDSDPDNNKNKNKDKDKDMNKHEDRQKDKHNLKKKKNPKKSATARVQPPPPPPPPKPERKITPNDGIQVSAKTTPKAIPKSSLKTTPKSKRKTAQSDTTKSSGKTTPKTTPKSSPKITPKTTPKSSPKAFAKSSVWPKAPPTEDPLQNAMESQPEPQALLIPDVADSKTNYGDENEKEEVEPSEEAKQIDELKPAQTSPPVSSRSVSPETSLPKDPPKSPASKKEPLADEPYPDEDRPDPSEFRMMLKLQRDGDQTQQDDYLPGTDPFAGSQKHRERANKKYGSSYSDSSNNTDPPPPTLSPTPKSPRYRPPNALRKTQNARETSRPEEFLGSEPQKLDRNKQKIIRSTSGKDYRATKVDAWLGGDPGKVQRRSYKVKKVRDISSETTGE